MLLVEKINIAPLKYPQAHHNGSQNKPLRGIHDPTMSTPALYMHKYSTYMNTHGQWWTAALWEAVTS